MEGLIHGGAYFWNFTVFSHVKIPSFRAKAHRVFHLCLYNKTSSSSRFPSKYQQLNYLGFSKILLVIGNKEWFRILFLLFVKRRLILMQALFSECSAKKQPLPKHLKNLNSFAHDNKIINFRSHQF